ncbi:MAG TPA: ABC transporter ATP-binding protein [Rugosimonospora sp.]|nr:ABC transporter ATP-binding protein [Rugosimonospora sp.]
MGGTTATFRRLWPYTRGYRGRLVTAALLGIVAAAGEVAAVRIFGIITDQVLATKTLARFWTPAELWLGVAAVSALATFASDYLTAGAAERLLYRLRNTVFAHVQTLSPGYVDNQRLGDLIARMTDDIEAIEALVATGLVQLVTASVSVLFFAAAALYLRWDLALVACALVPLFLLVSRLFAPRFQRAATQERESHAAMVSVVEESLSNHAVVQAYNCQPGERQRLAGAGRSWLRAKLAEARLTAAYGPLVQLVETVCVLTVLGMGAWELSAGRITLGGLLSFAAYLGYMYPPVQSLGQLSLTAAESGAAAERVTALMRARPSVVDRPDPDPRPWRAQGRIDFEGVSFRYPNSNRPTLDRLSLTAQPGELVLVAGPSGAGKSTVTKLLLRFYDPDGGRILLDGVDIRALPLRVLRENVTLLHQESMLFQGTVWDNIAYARPGATEQEILAAAVAADADGFIRTLPDGYRTDVGQRGRLLSGGQRQRIAIARAMLRGTPILVLDEPTTGLDDAAARRILEPLRRLVAGRTTIMITHDPHLVPEPDRVVELTPPSVTATAAVEHRGPRLSTVSLVGLLPVTGRHAAVPAPGVRTRYVGRARLTAGRARVRAPRQEA